MNRCKCHISTGPLEGINNKIKTIKRQVIMDEPREGLSYGACKEFKVLLLRVKNSYLD
ncbi:transposase [Halosquirtibacter laminarini]|uniref:Transposase n=1 Tax=Halosquirtibacter laminarini TaxID=3374600 RepID=A0AC61NPK5_9BACT|nr:transposase [Prolixibacteraceae bacterium]